MGRMDYRRKPLRELLKENVLRLKRDLSEQEIARRGGPSQRSVNRALHGANMNLNTVDELARGFRLEAWHLFVPNLDLGQLPAPSADEGPAARLYQKYQRANPDTRKAIDLLLRRDEEGDAMGSSGRARKSL